MIDGCSFDTVMETEDEGMSPSSQSSSLLHQQGGAIVLSSGADFSTDPGGVVILKDSTFIGSKADRETGGVIYGNEFSEMNITGDRNEFISNRCGTDGAVLAASKNTKVVVEGGNFTKNFAEEVRPGPT